MNSSVVLHLAGFVLLVAGAIIVQDAPPGSPIVLAGIMVMVLAALMIVAGFFLTVLAGISEGTLPQL